MRRLRHQTDGFAVVFAELIFCRGLALYARHLPSVLCMPMGLSSSACCTECIWGFAELIWLWATPLFPCSGIGSVLFLRNLLLHHQEASISYHFCLDIRMSTY